MQYITKNWVLRGLWFKKSLNSKFTPHIIGTLDENNCSWSYEKEFSVLSDFHSEYIFRDNKTLYICNMIKYRIIEVCYELILSAFNGGDMKSIQQRVRECKSTIQDTVSYLDYLGRSRDIKTDKFFDKFSDFANCLDDLVFQVEREGIEDCLKREIAVLCINDAKKKKTEIDANTDRWKMIIGVTDVEYDEFDPSQIKRKEYRYKQTLPINSNALDIQIELDIQQNEDRTISINGTTNLFDQASLMITIRNLDGYTKGGNTAIVRNAEIDFGKFTIQGEGYSTGTYKADVSLSLPSFQAPDFVRLAGQEYENMTGTLVKREGIGPIVRYTQQFSVV